MTMFATVTIRVDMPDGTSVLQIARQDTSINADVGSAESELTLAEALVIQLVDDALGSVQRRVAEIKGVTDGFDRHDTD